jgi:integrase
LPCSWLLVAPLEETVKSDRREFPQEMRSTLDRLWKRGTLPQRAGQSPQPERVFGFQLVICFHCGGAELGGRHVHDLRPTGSQFAANSGAALKDLMTRMGHDSERAALIISMRRGADQRITDAFDFDVQAERDDQGDDDDAGSAGALVPVD